MKEIHLKIAQSVKINSADAIFSKKKFINHTN